MVSRELLAAVLGVGLGLFIIAFPDAMIRIHMAGRGPAGRHGEYGEDGSFPRRWRLGVRAVGVIVVLIGLFFASQVLSVV